MDNAAEEDCFRGCRTMAWCLEGVTMKKGGTYAPVGNLVAERKEEKRLSVKQNKHWEKTRIQKCIPGGNESQQEGL